MEAPEGIEGLFIGKAATVRATYDRLLAVARGFGPLREEPKKTSIHLAHHAGFAGVHPRKGYLNLTLRTDYRIPSARVARAEQVSKNRYHNEVKLSAPDEVDDELAGWLRDAYTLA